MKAVRTLAAAGVLALSLAACSSSEPAGTAGGPAGSQKYVDNATFTMVLSSDPGSLDPAFTPGGVTLQTLEFLYDSLVSVDSKGQVQPNLAASWTNASTKTATFTLRKNITCSDGTPLTAATVADNINFIGNPASKSPSLGIFIPANAKATADNAAGTVTVTSPTPSPFLLQQLGGLPIVCAKGMKNRSILKQGSDGTGPYTLTQVVPGDHYVLTLRKDYAWGPGQWNGIPAGMPAKVVLKVVSNESTAANLLLAGTVNAASVFGPDQQRLRAKGLFERDLYLGEELWFNEASGLPTADETVRKALTQALDLTTLGKVATNGVGKSPSGLVYRDKNPCPVKPVLSELPSKDVSAAKSTLASRHLSLTLYYLSDLGPSISAAAELVQKSWSDAGVTVTLKPAPQGQLTQDVLAGQAAWSAALIPLGSPLPGQLVGFLSGPTPPNGSNFASIQVPEFTAAVQAASAQPGTAGCPDWAAAENALYAHVNPVPYVDSARPTFGDKATFDLGLAGVSPTSIRMLG